MKKIIRGLAIAGAIAGITSGLGVVGAQAADEGDTTTSCIAGEICFSKDSPASNVQRHFWYGAVHGGMNYTYGQAVKFQDSISSFHNRDQTARLFLYNYSGGAYNDIELLRTNGWFSLNSSGWQDINDGHKLV